MDKLADLRSLIATAGEAVFVVKVTPRSSRNEVAGRLPDGAWKIKVAAAPEKGRANQELCAFLAGALGLPKSNVTVESGHTSQRKRLRARL